MAKLYFKVGSDWEEVIRLRNEIAKLKQELMNMDSTQSPAAFKALNGRAMFIVAGAPACMDDLKAAGIENFIHVRVNVLETLKEFNAKLLK